MMAALSAGRASASTRSRADADLRPRRLRRSRGRRRSGARLRSRRRAVRGTAAADSGLIGSPIAMQPGGNAVDGDIGSRPARGSCVARRVLERSDVTRRARSSAVRHRRAPLGGDSGGRHPSTTPRHAGAGDRHEFRHAAEAELVLARTQRGSRPQADAHSPSRALPQRRGRHATDQPDAGTTASTTGRPSVSVPVLSRTTAVTRCAVSSASPPRMRMPASAPRPVPTMIAVGVARPIAHGQAMTSDADECGQRVA